MKLWKKFNHLVLVFVNMIYIYFGCRRTQDEVGKWSTFSNIEKQAIIDETAKRRNVEGEEPTIFLR